MANKSSSNTPSTSSGGASSAASGSIHHTPRLFTRTKKTRTKNRIFNESEPNRPILKKPNRTEIEKSILHTPKLKGVLWCTYSCQFLCVRLKIYSKIAIILIS